MKDNFFKNSFILTLTNSTMGILKFVFSIILSRDLGAEGMGLYGLIMPIYDLFCCIVCGGLITAVSKEGAVYWDKKEYGNLNKSINICLFFDFIWSFFVAFLLFFSSSFISKYIIQDSRATFSLMIISPAIIFVALSSILKGYFYASSKVTTPAVIDIFEKTVRISAVIAIINILVLKDIQKTVTAVYAALSLGEIISFILLYISYKKQSSIYKSPPGFKSENKIQLFFNIFVVSFPLCVNAFLSTAIGTASTLIVPERLLHCGFSHAESLSMIGKFSSMAINIVLFPMVIITSMSIVLIPDLSQNLASRNFYSLEKRIKSVIKISLLLGISTMFICLSIPYNLGMLFYKRNDLSEYIKFSALSLPFLYVSATTFSILSGLGKQKQILINSIIVSVEELIIQYILTGIPKINIFGIGISLMITSITSIIINMKEILKKCYVHFSVYEIFIYFGIGFITYYLIIILNNTINFPNFILKNIFLIAFGFALYFYLNFLINKASILE